MPKVSIIVRTKNEEKWIASCLEAIREQNFKDYEIVLVDDGSTDRTLEKAEPFGVKLVHYSGAYLPGKSLNVGIRQSIGDFFVCISGHCIPTTPDWLGNLVRNFDDPKVAGVYGRQEPLPFSADRDKRDLLTVFGLDRKVQTKDSFFHNANSMLRRSLWDQVPFDEETTNIEDRLWAKAMLEKGFSLVYEPEASVYHWHGIHQDGDSERCRNVVRILESLDLLSSVQTSKKTSNLKVCAVIPIKGDPLEVEGRSLLEYTIRRAKQSELINHVYVYTDSQRTADIALRLGAEVPFLRPTQLSHDYVGMEGVLKQFVLDIEKAGIVPDVIISMTETYPFRSRKIVDEMIKELFYKKLDALIPVYAEYKSCFRKQGKSYEWLDKGFVPRQYKDPIYVSLAGLGMVVSALALKKGPISEGNVGIYPVENALSPIEVTPESDKHHMAKLLDEFWEKEPVTATR